MEKRKCFGTTEYSARNLICCNCYLKEECGQVKNKVERRPRAIRKDE